MPALGVLHRLKSPLSRFPQPPAQVKKILGLVIPLIVIALGVYVFYNFPALKQKLEYTLNKPKPGNPALLPPTLKKPATNAPKVAGQIPVATGPQCGGNIPYDNAGNPTKVCDNYIYIPKIRVAAPIVNPPSTKEAVINDFLLKGVVRYPGTAEPGQKGNVFLTGHSSYYWWAKSEYKTVFTLVPEMRLMDEIIIYYNGTRYTYKVSEIREVSPQTTEVLRPTSEPVVTLSTCVPIGSTARRKIVRAKQISPDPAAARAASTSQVNVGRLPGVR